MKTPLKFVITAIMVILPFAVIYKECANQTTPHEINTEPVQLSLNEVIDTCSVYYNIPRAVIIGTATLETGIGRGGVGKNANNLFSIRSYDWSGDVYKACDTCRCWRKYETPQHSVVDFCLFVHKKYPYMIGRPVEEWALYGYEKGGLFDKKGCFVKFK